MPVAEALDALDEFIDSDVVQITVAQIERNQLLRLFGPRTPPRFAGLVGETGLEEGGPMATSRVREMLEADAATLPPLLETYLRNLLARAMGASPAQIDIQQPLHNLGLNSLISVEVRNHINADLAMNVPLAIFTQSTSVRALAAYLAERMLDGNRGDQLKATDPPTAATLQSDIPAIGDDTADLLERVDELTDEEVDQQLSVLAARGPG